MNTAPLRSLRLLIPTALVVLALAVGGVVWATTASADLRGGERDRVARAATDAVGGGEVLSAETSDDRGREAYEVEVRTTDGSEVEVSLDRDLDVLGQDSDDDRTDGRDDRDDDGRDADDRALSAAERASAERAALAAVGGGSVTEVEAGDDGREAYEIDVRAADGTAWDVALDADFEVLEKKLED